MGERQYLIMFDLDVRKRHYHKTESGKVIAFMAQLEIKISDVWKEVIQQFTVNHPGDLYYI